MRNKSFIATVADAWIIPATYYVLFNISIREHVQVASLMKFQAKVSDLLNVWLITTTSTNGAAGIFFGPSYSVTALDSWLHYSTILATDQAELFFKKILANQKGPEFTVTFTIIFSN